jgi:DNA-binding XRE family transcriptional regulator
MQAAELVPKISKARRRVDGAHLSAARLSRGLTQEQLARLLDVRVATISERENSSGVAWETWLAWAFCLGLPGDWTPQGESPLASASTKPES